MQPAVCAASAEGFMDPRRILPLFDVAFEVW